MDDLFATRQRAPMKRVITDRCPPPDIVDILAGFLETWQRQARPWPEGFPAAPKQAAKVFVGLMEPPDRFRDRPSPRHKDGKVIGWSTPYHDRLLLALQKFVAFNSVQQVYIVEHIRAGIPWRGEDGRQYAFIVEHSQPVKGATA